jgi:hypothetical protein
VEHTPATATTASEPADAVRNNPREEEQIKTEHGIGRIRSKRISDTREPRTIGSPTADGQPIRAPENALSGKPKELRIPFRENSVDVDSTALPILRVVAAALKQRVLSRVIVEGRGSLPIADRGALNIIQLIVKYGAANETIRSLSYGESPAVETDTPDAILHLEYSP